MESMNIMQTFGSESEVVRFRGLSTTFRFLTVLYRKCRKEIQDKNGLDVSYHIRGAPPSFGATLEQLIWHTGLIIMVRGP